MLFGLFYTEAELKARISEVTAKFSKVINSLQAELKATSLECNEVKDKLKKFDDHISLLEEIISKSREDLEAYKKESKKTIETLTDGNALLVKELEEKSLKIYYKLKDGQANKLTKKKMSDDIFEIIKDRLK